MALKFDGGSRTTPYSPMFNNLAHANQNGLLTDCEVEAQASPNMSVKINAGRIFFETNRIDVAEQNISVDSADAQTRIDVVLINSSGVCSILKGTAGLLPAPADYDPDLYIALALIFVNPVTTAIQTDNIKDVRVLNTGGGGSTGGTFERYIDTFTSQTTVTVNHNLGDLFPMIQVYDNSGVLIEESDISSITINDSNTITIVFESAKSGYALVFGGIGINNGYYTNTYTALTTWTVIHNLGQKYPQVTVFNSSDQIVDPTTYTVTVTDSNNLSIVFSGATTGRVVVTGGTATLRDAVLNYINLISNTYADVPNNTIFNDSANNVIKVKGNTGIATELTEDFTESATYTYDVNKILQSITYTRGTETITYNYTYNGDGTIHTISHVRNSKTITITYSYTDGLVTGHTKTIV